MMIGIPRHRAVITGIGAVAPSGVGKSEFWRALRAGTNCVDAITSFDTSDYPSKMAAEIRDFRVHDFLTRSTKSRRMARSSQLAVAGARLALDDAQVDDADCTQMSVILGSATAGTEFIVPQARTLERDGIRRISPFLGIAGFGGSVSSEVSRAIGAHGASHTLSTGCCSSTDALGNAMRSIQTGMTEIAITGGAEASVNAGMLAAFCRMGAVSTRNNAYRNASRPFNRDRDGFVIGEGSWIFVLEERTRAIRRGAHVYGELAGYGATCDAWEMAKPHASGRYTVEAINQALDEAHLSPDDIDLFEAYGNSTPTNDSYETGVIKSVFGSQSARLAVPAAKSMLGHPIGASGAQQVAAALLALDQGFIHPTINYDTPDPDCNLDYVPNTGRSGVWRNAVCNSLGFGGKNSAIVVTAA